MLSSIWNLNSFLNIDNELSTSSYTWRVLRCEIYKLRAEYLVDNFSPASETKFTSTLQIYLRRSEDIFEQYQLISRLKKSDVLSRPQSEKTRQADRRTAQCNFHLTKRNPVEIDDGRRRVTRGSWLSVSRPDSSWLHSTLSTQCTCTMLSGVHRERVRDQSGPFVRSFLQTSFWTDKSVRQHEGQATLRY